MDQRLSLVTLGVADLDASRHFYEALGWRTGPSPDHIVFFQAGATVVALWERAALAVDSGIETPEHEGEDPGRGHDAPSISDGSSSSSGSSPSGGCCTEVQWGGQVLGVNVRSAGDVDEQIAQAAQAGARILRPAGTRYWGGYSGVFADPDGHLWEIAYNPYWSVTDDGRTLLGDGRG